MRECLGREPEGELNLGIEAGVRPDSGGAGEEAMLQARWMVAEEWPTREGRVKGGGGAHVAAFVRIQGSCQTNGPIWRTLW